MEDNMVDEIVQRIAMKNARFLNQFEAKTIWHVLKISSDQQIPLKVKFVYAYGNDVRYEYHSLSRNQTRTVWNLCRVNITDHIESLFDGQPMKPTGVLKRTKVYHFEYAPNK